MISTWVIARLPSSRRSNRFRRSFFLRLLGGRSLLVLRADAVSCVCEGARLSARFARGREDEEPFPDSRIHLRRLQGQGLPRTGSSSEAVRVSPQAQQLNCVRSDARPRINVKGIIYESVVWRTKATCLLTPPTYLTSYSVYTTSERTATALDRERGCLHVLCT